jgi:dethiobiotin synthetase
MPQKSKANNPLLVARFSVRSDTIDHMAGMIRPSHALLVTGTDTGVGKTVVTGALASLLLQRGCRPGVMKPFATGGEWRDGRLVSPDALFLTRAAKDETPLDLVNPVLLETPASPLAASRLEDKPTDLKAVDRTFDELRERHRFLLVEGVGGLLVPIAPDILLIDFLARWPLRVLLVARPGLGTLNHTLLSIEAVRARNLPLCGVLFCEAVSPDPGDSSLPDNAGLIEEFGQTPVLGTIRYNRKISVETGKIDGLSSLLPADFDLSLLYPELERGPR